SGSDLRPASLVLDQGAVTLSAIRNWCFLGWCIDGDTPSVTVHARDKSGAWPLEGIVARLEPGLIAPGPGFDPKAQMKVGFDDDESEVDIFSAPAPGKRVVPAHGQATITLAFEDLPAGEYTVPLRFTAGNSSEDDAQRLTITLKVRDHVIGAVLVLV